MTNLNLPVWGYWLMGLGLAFFIGMIVLYAVKYHGFRRPIFASPYILWIIVFTVLPCLLVAYYAFTDTTGSFSFENFQSFWDSNYRARMQNKELIDSYAKMGISAEELGFGRGMDNINSLIYSLWMAFLCTVICLVMGYPAAHIMADRDFKLGPTLVTLFIIPMWMNFLLRTVAMMSILEENGLVNQILHLLGFGDQHLLGTSSAVQLGMVYNYLPFMVFPIYNILNKMDMRYSEAAMDLGCNKWQTFYKVTLPLSIPGVVSGITMVFMPAVTTFYISRLLGSGRITMFGDLIESKFLSTSMQEWNVGSALSLVMMVLILISLKLLRKVDPEGEGGGTI